ncbi:hypothetical protein KXD93_26015 [Mucilaginibacter sp. BJC16-A38]|uniref:transposase n=1 Tax=Mucilaginibacter phenanthrenivorans TaxID=1234842 RepID=UPI0021578C92|nr:transposase [Mucilaginibacter phenanthrenivorans]MCR8561141.1 hypothetical protein [Mucilaginibacter phenanthrenivorans]
MKYNPLTHNRKSIRLKGYDYSQSGAYFITICTYGMQLFFGDVINEEMNLNEMGQIAYNEWLKTPEIRPYASLDIFVIMPNHMHGIIFLDDASMQPLPASTSPISNSVKHDDDFVSSLKSPSHSIGAIVRGYKSSVTKQINLLNETGTVWQRNYHEHIIRNEKSYSRIFDYIINNPSKWAEDKFYVK